MAKVTAADIGLTTGATDQAAAINAAFLDPGVTEVELDAHYWIDRSVVMQHSGQAFTSPNPKLAGIRALPTFSGYNIYNGMVIPPFDSNGAFVPLEGLQVRGLTIDGSKSGIAGGLNDRVHGVLMGRAKDFYCSDLIVQNITGYGRFAQGVESANGVDGPGADYASGMWERCVTLNCSIHSEQMASKNVKDIDGQFYDGDGDIQCQSWLHPLSGCKDISYIRPYARGSSSAGVEITSNVSAMSNLRIDGADLISDRGIGIVSNGSFGLTRFHLADSYIETGYLGTNLALIQGEMHSSTFVGKSVGIQAASGFGVDIDAYGCTAIANETQSGTFALNSPDGGVRWHGGKLIAQSPGGSFPYTTGSVVSPQTILMPGRGGYYFAKIGQSLFSNDGSVGSVIGSADPWTFQMKAGRKYLVTVVGEWSQSSAAQGMSLGFTGTASISGAAGYVSLDNGTGNRSGVTNLSGAGNPGAGITVNSVATANAFYPMEVNITLLCSASGSASLQYRATGAVASIKAGSTIIVREI